MYSKDSCVICGKPAKRFVIVRDAVATYKFGEGPRCEDHLRRALEVFKQVDDYPLDEVGKRRTRRGR